MAEYSKDEIKKIEEKWRSEWVKRKVYEVSNDSPKPKYYVLDMFPYPSGAGLHVGHPLGYIASDIVARYKRLQGFNVLHPMGFDAFGLPAEQYAIEHGIHPAISTAHNIENFKKQFEKIGFGYDWSREVQTCDPEYYKWTQWIFLQIFDSWFNRKKEKAERISVLIKIFETEGNVNYPIQNSKFKIQELEGLTFTADQWKAFGEKTQQEILMQYRLAYLAYTDVNWCEALGTVLANDEVVNGVSYRGGFPVVKRQMRQWSLRITEYAERLLKGLEEIDFSESMKEIQRNWIGKSVGAKITFRIKLQGLEGLTPSPSPKERGTDADKGMEIGLDKNSDKGLGEEPGYETSEKKYWKYLKDFAKDNRQNATEEEAVLWEELRNSKLGHKIRRQHAIGIFIADFACLDKRLVIEVDGGYHIANAEFDKARTEFLNSEGFKVVRFTNEQVKQDLNKVVNEIKEALEGVTGLTPNPSPKERGTDADKGIETGSYKGVGLAEADSLSFGEGRGEAFYKSDLNLTVFTTRPDTIFGVDFMVVAPEHELVKDITSKAQQGEIDQYLKYVESRSEIERMAEVKKITGAFTGAYAINPFNGREIPIWISEYVLAGYGTGAIMGVPCGDERDYKFAKHFNLPITNILGSFYDGKEANPTYDAVLENSGFLNGMKMKEASTVVVNKVEEMDIGKKQVNYRMRDAGWSRQRYWGEPFPVVFRDDMPYAMDEKELPLALPPSDNFKSAGNGEGPLANLKDWINISDTEKRDSNTMPTHAGAAWYFLRYMDPHNKGAFADRKALEYWNQVDVYIGGSEHAVAHLLYARLWIKILCDLGYINFDEPFKKLINQGKITGDSRFVYRLLKATHSNESDSDKKIIDTDKFPQVFISKNLKERIEKEIPSLKESQVIGKIEIALNNSYRKSDEHGGINFNRKVFQPLHVDINAVNGEILDIEDFRKWKEEFKNAEFIFDDGTTSVFGETGEYICGSAIEKMSKSYYNVVNPDEIIDKYGADTLRLYEMFLGPLEQSKPWSTSGIDGVYKFLRRFWNLFHDSTGKFMVTDEEPTREELKALHKAIKKIASDIDNFSFNTSVSEFMICANELSSLKCNKRQVLEPLVIALAPFAPHISEELWSLLGHNDTVLNASFPKHDDQYLTENSFEYPISINGKVRAKMNFALDMPKEDMEKLVLASEAVQKWSEGKVPKKVIIVQGKIVNIVM